ncbi:hypothetical protein [Mariniflexile sp. AS56]|uniref:hypothetical protein n=1 Tax=Mariniflexile sp. AS56 TaxID=3063957 RepID=UPI0026EB559A|nr:hypothetical protein [Mariniflexile sp. AS56]MDO7171875.1 hypothetical protein [Mariniflexile sp. AS56]
MKLFATYSNCKHEINFSSNYNTRVELAMYDGEIKTLNCKNCNLNSNFKVNELYAKESKTALIIASLILIIGTPILIYYIPMFLLRHGGLYSTLAIASFFLIPVIVYSNILKEERIRVNTFNRDWLKD